MLRFIALLALSLGAHLALAQEAELEDPVGLNDGVAVLMDGVNWDEAEVIELLLDDHAYEPATLTLERNKPYIFKLKNIGRVSHDMVGGSFFSGIAIKMAQNRHGRVVTPVLRSVYIKRGQTMEMWFVPIRAGVYDFFCGIDDHQEQGMEGEITIR